MSISCLKKLVITDLKIHNQFIFRSLLIVLTSGVFSDERSAYQKYSSCISLRFYPYNKRNGSMSESVKASKLGGYILRCYFSQLPIGK